MIAFSVLTAVFALSLAVSLFVKDYMQHRLDGARLTAYGLVAASAIISLSTHAFH